MYTMVMNLPNLDYQRISRPRSCPHCKSTILQKWGRASKPLKDLDQQQAEVHRYRCTDCSKTFRTYPPGIERSSRSKRMRSLAGFTWALGLSLDSVVDVFQCLGVEMSRTTIWRDGHTTITKNRNAGRDRIVTVHSIQTLEANDGSAIFTENNQAPHNDNSLRARPSFLDGEEITLILNIGRRYILLGVIDIDGPRAAREWLQALAGEFGMEVNISTKPSNNRYLN